MGRSISRIPAIALERTERYCAVKGHACNLQLHVMLTNRVGFSFGSPVWIRTRIHGSKGVFTEIDLSEAGHRRTRRIKANRVRRSRTTRLKSRASSMRSRIFLVPLRLLRPTKNPCTISPRRASSTFWYANVSQRLLEHLHGFSLGERTFGWLSDYKPSGDRCDF